MGFCSPGQIWWHLRLVSCHRAKIRLTAIVSFDWEGFLNLYSERRSQPDLFQQSIIKGNVPCPATWVAQPVVSVTQLRLCSRDEARWGFILWPHVESRGTVSSARDPLQAVAAGAWWNRSAQCWSVAGEYCFAEWLHSVRAFSEKWIQS